MTTVSDIENENDVGALYPLMRQLRPNLASEADFLARWKRQSADGYRLIAAYERGRPRALAGFRIQENLVYGRFLYVDDLVTDADTRDQGLGERLMVHLRGQARASGCNRLVLDTPMSNALGHRFYFRCGLLATALRFSIEA